MSATEKRGLNARPAAAKESVDRRTMLAGLTVFALVTPRATAVLGGRTSARAASGKQYFFDFANVLECGELFKEFGDGLAAAAHVTGIRIKRYNNDNDPQTSVNNARLMAQDKPDLILEY